MSAPSTATPETAPFQPIDYTTWEATPEAARIADPLERIQAFDNRTRKDLFAAGMYDAEAEAEISAAGADQALRAGLITDPAEYAPVAKPRDPNFLARQLVRQGDTAKAGDIFRYQSFLSRPDTDPETLERARLAAQLDPETENELVRSAVRSGELPFAVVPDKDGNPVFEIDPELGALDRQQILDLAGDDVDPRFLPDLERQLTRVGGTNLTPAQFRQAAVFDSFLKRQAAEDPFLGDVLQRAQTEYDRTGRLSTETQEELDRNLAALDADNEFAPATRARLIRDTIKRGSKPEAYDPENPQQHIQYLEDGTVWVPEQVVFDQAKHDALLDSLDITPEQREAAKKLRAGRLDAIAPSMVDAMGADPGALEFFEKSKAAGKTDAEIATEWYSKPENYGSFSNRARSFGMSLIEAGPGLVQSVAALAGSDSAREALAARARDTARNEEYARLFGDSYGVGQSLLNTSSQVAADLLAGLAVSAVATPVAGAAVAGSRAAASSLVRGLARTALTEGARSTAAGFLRSATGSAARTLATIGDDVATNLARSIAAQTGVAASSFTRSAGSAYVQAYSALDAQTNAQGQPLYSDAEKRKIALGTAMTAGTATAAITLGFGKLLGPGVEGLVTGKLGTSALRRLFGATDDQIISATRESALAILKSAGQEAPEEAVDQLVGNVIQAVGTGEEFRLGPALKEALEAGLVGGLLGAGTKSIELGVDKFRSPKVEALEKAGAPATAAALEAATKAQAEAPADPVADLKEAAADVGLRVAELKAQVQELSGDPENNKGKLARAKKRLAEATAEKTRLDFAIKNPGTMRMGTEPRRTEFEPAAPVEGAAAPDTPVEGAAAPTPEARPVTRDRRTNALTRVLVNKGVADGPAMRFAASFARNLNPETTLEEARGQILDAFRNAGGRFLDEVADTAAIRTNPQTWIDAGYTPEDATRFAELAQAEIETAAAEVDAANDALEIPEPEPVEAPTAAEVDAAPALEETPVTPEDIIGTDQAPEPPVVEPGETELDYGDGGELTVQDNTLGGPAPVRAPAPTPTPAKKPTGEKQLAADVRQGKPLAVHQSLFDDTISQGWVPTRNVLLNQLKAAGFGGQVYGTAFSETVQARIRELYPLVDVPKTAVSKTLKSLGLGDIKVGNKLVSIPVNPDGTTAPFTNDPQVTAWQKAAGLSVKVPAGVTVNPAIKVNPKTGTVDSAIDQTGRTIATRGDVKRPGSVVGDYEAFQNKTPFGVSLMTLPPPDFSTLPRPVDFAGYTIKPGETTEDDLLRYFVVAPTPGGQSRLEQAIESRAPKNFTSVQKEAVRSAAQLSFIREIREFMMGVNAAGNVDAAGFGHKTTQSYKKYLQDRATTVWSQAGKAKDGTVDTSTHWDERGRPSHLSFFVDTAIKAHADGASRRTDANVQLGSDDVDQETALERAAARNEAGDAGDTLVALDEAFTPEVLRGAAALIGTTDLMDTASGIQMLVERLDSVPALRKAFEQAYVGSLDLPPGPGARRALAIMQAKQMDASDLVVVAARAALVQPGVLQAVREAGFFKSLSYGLNTFTDAEVEQHRADNRAAIADLQLDGDLRSALERIARSAKYPRRYRAIMLAALKMPVLPSLAIIDAPTEAYAGSYIHSGRLITLNIASSNGRGLLDVLAHELLHAATIEAVANPQTRAARELRDRLERARQKAADVVPAEMAYAVSSLDEFITHAATDPRLQVILRETFERGKTTWQRVVEAIARFFGIANNDFVSDLWGFINHAAEYGYRVGVAASREPGPLSARFRPSSPDIRYSPASRRNQLRVRLTREALTNMALEQAEWKDWYSTHQDTLDEFFGDHSGMFQSILAATSQAATVKSNVALALRAFGQWIRGEAFEGFLPAVRMNLERLRNEVQLEGQKISAYRAANEGDSDQVVVDRHIARLLFGVETPSRAQFQKATTVLTQIAESLGWKPSQVQAALWAASIVKSGKTPESYADYLRKLEAKSEVGSRIGAPVAGSPGIDGAGGDRGRFAPRGAQASGRDGGDPGSVDQHLPTLPDGLAYAYDETRPRYLAYARRSQPGTVTINRAALASLVEGLDPANARAIVRKIVNHEIAHLAAFQAFTDAELDEMAAALSTSELADIARKYYGTPDSMQRMATDLASGTLTRAALVEEWLRSVAELVTDGGTTEETIAFHSANPGMVARILRYIRDYVRALWTRVAGPKEDFATRVSINRLMREYRDIKRGHMPPVAEPFDTSDPYRDNKRAALAPADTDPEATVLSDIMRRETFIDFAGAYTAPAEGWRGTLKQILQTRTGDPRFEAVKNERTGRLNAANQLLANRQKAMSKAIKAEKPDRDLVNRALGDSSPTIPTAVRKQLRADYESAVGEIRAFYNEQAQDANADLEQIARDEKVALREAYAEYDKLRRDALVETARAKKTAISAAMEELRAVAPQTAAAVKKFRSGIDSLSKVMRDTHPEDSYLHAVIDENLGVYLTRTYRAHHGDGDPLAILNSKDPADMETVAAAEKLFVDTIVEGRAEEIMEEEAENDRYISFDEALELARAWAAENELGRRALEDYIASHGSRAFYHGGGNFKIDLTRYMQKVDVPEALRKVLGEVNDPVENAARTFANVAHMAANFRFIEDLARGGKSSGALVTKAQKDGFADMVREPDEDAYLQQTIDYGFARRKPAAGYVKVAGDIYHPAWLIEARANRDFQMLDAYEPLATTSAKYGAGSLDGLFAAPLVKALYENSMPKPPTLESEKMVHRFGSFFAKATGASLGIATVTNPAFHARNALGGTLFLGANGINPFAGFGTVSQHFADLVAGKDNPEVTKRIALGIYSDDIRPQAIKELIKDEIDKPGDKSGFEWFGSLIGGKKGERIGELVAAGALKLTDVASAIDSVLKGRAYEAELETLRKAYPDGSKTESELERMAAGIVKRTMQSRSMTVPIAEDVTRSSFGRLFAPFLRFKAEMFRITHGTVSQALDEIKSGNPVLRARGYQRMSGFAMVAAASLAGPALISALMGVGEEEEIALREALPPYLRGNSMVYVASGGSVTSLDLTFVNPYSMIFDPVSRSARALLRGEADKAPGELASWLHGQFLEEQIAAGAVLEVLNNRTSDNKPITLETDGFGDQVVKYSKHLLGSAYTPQVAKIVDRAIEAQRRGVPEDAEFFETPAGVLSTAIVPARPRTYEASELALRAFKSKAQTLRDIRTKQGRLKIRQNLDAQDVNEIVLDQFESISSLYEDLGRIARGYEGLGLTKAQVIKEMVNAGHSREKARGVVAAGYVPAPSLTPAAKRDIFDAGQEVDKNGGGERRVRLVVEAQRALPRVIEIDGAEGED